MVIALVAELEMRKPKSHDMQAIAAYLHHARSFDSATSTGRGNVHPPAQQNADSPLQVISVGGFSW